jgi:hypothetical protein
LHSVRRLRRSYSCAPLGGFLFPDAPPTACVVGCDLFAASRLGLVENYCSRSTLAGSILRARLTGPATESDPVSSNVNATAKSTNGSWAEA